MYHLTVGVVQLCAGISSPAELIGAYRARAEIHLFFASEFVLLAERYDAFANEVAVAEEFALSQSSLDVYLAGEILDVRAKWLRDESVRLIADAGALTVRAELVDERYRGLRRFRVRAMRAECLAVLSDSG